MPYDGGSSASANEALPADTDVEALRGGITRKIEEWLNDCLTGVSGQELTHAEMLARDAVVEGVLDSRE